MKNALLLILLTATAILFWFGQGAAQTESPPDSQTQVEILLFWAENCPHCGKEKAFLEGLKRRYPGLTVDAREIWNNRTHFEQFRRLSEASGGSISTPATFIGHSAWYGFNQQIAAEIEEKVRRCLEVKCEHPLKLAEEGRLSEPPGSSPREESSVTVNVPGLGQLDGRDVSLPLFTLILGFLDGFNPCAFFVFLFLLSLLIHLRSRIRMLLVGGIFVLFSGLFYFLFMAAWLNLFLSAGHMRMVTLAAGVVAVLMGSLNIKDFFFFQKGFSLSLSEEAKPRLFKRMRGLLNAPRLSSLIAATIILAAAANSYELLCTAGFPMVYTRVLTFHDLPTWQYYLFLSLYNLVYIVPLIVILVIVTKTLGHAHLSEWQGRVLKLLSGTMMFALGSILLLRPSLLNHLGTAVGLIIGAAFITLVLTRYFHPKRK